MTISVKVNLDERSYNILIGPGASKDIAGCLPDGVTGRSCFIVTDDNVREPYALAVKESLVKAGARGAEIFSMRPGEAMKSWEGLQSVLGWLLDRRVDRKSVLFAVGGGVIGDLAGFAAAIVMRGVPFVQVPTTLLAMVDSSVGGKTAIDVPQGKNLVGAFHQPLAVIADTDVLKTLPARELRAGYAECVKHAAIFDESLFGWYEENGKKILALDPRALAENIERNCRIKAAIVEADEREAGKRALLNLGHTFGHALESAVGYDGRLLHGEAVSIGMMLAFDVSRRMGLCPESDCVRLGTHLKKSGLPVRIADIRPALTATPEQLVGLMHGDKKAAGGKITFVLSKGIGKAFLCPDAPMDLITEAVLDSRKGEK